MLKSFSAPYRAQFFRDVAMFFRMGFEFWRGLHFLRDTTRAITIFGSARLPENHPYCLQATALAKSFAESGISVITGGGPGIMQAASKGAFHSKGASIGINIKIPREQHINPYVNRGFISRYFFIRKVLLCRYSEAFIVFPGGFGTLDELFEIITLLQTKKMLPRPIIFIDRKFWSGLLDWCHQTLLSQGMISADDLKRFVIVDTADEALKILKLNA